MKYDPLFNKVRLLATKGEKYALKDAERDVAKKLVREGFLYYAGDYDHVGARDVRHLELSSEPEKKKSKFRSGRAIEWSDPE